MKLSDELQHLAKSIEGLTEEVRGVAEDRSHIESNLAGVDQVLSEVSEKLQWLCNQLVRNDWRPSTPGPTRFVGTEGQDRESYSDTQDRENYEASCALACVSCDADPPPSLEHALRDGWTQLQYDDAEGWDFLGKCPACRTAELDEELTRAKTAGEKVGEFLASDGPVGEKITVDAAELAEEMEQYCCAEPKLEWNGDPDHPGVACANCGMVVAENGSIVTYTEEELQELRQSKDRQTSLFEE